MNFSGFTGADSVAQILCDRNSSENCYDLALTVQLPEYIPKK